MARNKEIVATESDGTLVRHVGLKETDDSTLPSPELLSQYEQILPGSMDRILTLMEKYSDAYLEESATNNEIAREDVGVKKRAQVFAFVLAMTIVIVGGILQYTGTDYGFYTILTGVAAIVAAFVADAFRRPQDVVVVSEEDYVRLGGDDSEDEE